MAKRSKSPSTWIEALTEHDEQLLPHLRAERKRVFVDWTTRLADRGPPTSQELRRYCKYLLDRPHQIEGPYAPYIFLVLQKWLAKTPSSKKTYTAKQIADLVDWVVDTEKLPPSEARDKVAKAFRMTVEAVKQSHLTQGKSRRKKLP